MRHVSGVQCLMLISAFVTVSIVAGCTSTPLRTEKSTSGIRAAEEAGAAQVPQASLHLQLAKEELAKARALYADGNKDKAATMLLRAEADAELAVVLSRKDAERAEANEAVARVRQLRMDNP